MAPVDNAAVLLGPDGALLARHRKVSELDIALRLYTPGTSLAVTATPIGAVGLGPVVGGEWEGRRCIGRSLAVGPGGEVLAFGPYDAEALLVVDVPLRDSGDLPEPVRASRSG